jgi:hypothetical protein
MAGTINLENPRMSEGERGVLTAALAQAGRYLEFGAGGSTLMAARSPARSIVTVDSDQKWVGAVCGHPEIAQRMADGSMSVLHADIGPIRDWGFPANEDHKPRWPSYLGVAWSEWARRGEQPDLVFVDGRFRVACCLSVVVAFGGGLSAASPTVLLHDVVKERQYYKDVLQFFEAESVVETLYRMKIRPDASPLAALALLLERQFDDR